jgi:hypothetical protein
LEVIRLKGRLKLTLTAITVFLIGLTTINHFRGFDEAMVALGNFLMLSGIGVFVAAILKKK